MSIYKQQRTFQPFDKGILDSSQKIKIKIKRPILVVTWFVHYPWLTLCMTKTVPTVNMHQTWLITFRKNTT